MFLFNASNNLVFTENEESSYFIFFADGSDLVWRGIIDLVFQTNELKDSDSSSSTYLDMTTELNFRKLFLSIALTWSKTSAIFHNSKLADAMKALVNWLKELRTHTADASAAKKSLEFGLQTEILQVLSNVLYRNKGAKEIIHQMNAMPILIECCTYQDLETQPLRREWAIVAVRNANMD